MYFKILLGVLQMDNFLAIAAEIKLLSNVTEHQTEKEVSEKIKSRIRLVHIFSVVMGISTIICCVMCTYYYY